MLAQCNGLTNILAYCSMLILFNANLSSMQNTHIYVLETTRKPRPGEINGKGRLYCFVLRVYLRFTVGYFVIKHYYYFTRPNNVNNYTRPNSVNNYTNSLLKFKNWRCLNYAYIFMHMSTQLVQI